MSYEHSMYISNIRISGYVTIGGGIIVAGKVGRDYPLDYLHMLLNRNTPKTVSVLKKYVKTK